MQGLGFRVLDLAFSVLGFTFRATPDCLKARNPSIKHVKHEA